MTIIKKKLSSDPAIKYVKYKELKQGELVVVGALTEVKMVKPFAPVNYKGEKNPDVPQYVFTTDEGTVVLNSSSELNKELVHATIGDILEITFLGKENRKTKQGVPYSCFMFDVQCLIDDEEDAA